MRTRPLRSVAYKCPEPPGEPVGRRVLRFPETRSPPMRNSGSAHQRRTARDIISRGAIMKSCPAFFLASVSLFAQTATVQVDTSRVINSFDPDSALGSSIDVLSKTGIDKVYTPHIVQEALSAGWGPITYRNNTELRMAAWHWTENGTWSDPAHKSGYFTGSSELKEPLRYILSYALPHRGFSPAATGRPQGPNQTYWKSNPYLTSKFTGESDALHPQWVVLDLRADKPVSAVEIAWANPYAKTYQVDYWVGRNPLSRAPEGQWKTFPSGAVKNGAGGTVTLKLAPDAVSTRYRPHLDDGIVEHLRPPRFGRHSQLRRLCDPGFQGGHHRCRGAFDGETADAATRPPRSIRGIRRPTSTPPEAASTPASTSSSPAASPTICPR